MNPIINPYSPGAGTPPPELAGREQIRETVKIALERARMCKPEKNIVLTGLRGVGKTVLMVRMYEDAKSAGMKTIFVETPEKQSLPALLAPQLRSVLLSMSPSEQMRRALSALINFAKAFEVKIGEIGVSWESKPGLADNGNLEHDLPALLESIGETAKAEQAVLVLFIDELQYTKEDVLGALCAALHKIAQHRLPILFIGAGLPQLHGHTGRAKSYAERLFNFTEIGRLPLPAAKDAIIKPAQAKGVLIDADALGEIFKKTQGYPYFLQEWGKHVWNIADSSPITLEHVMRASQSAIEALDTSFFRVRFDRLTPSEKHYLWAMTQLDKGPSFRIADIAEVLQKKVSSLAPMRGNLINKGMIYSSAHGNVAFTVPLFDEFIGRSMPRDGTQLDLF